MSWQAGLAPIIEPTRAVGLGLGGDEDEDDEDDEEGGDEEGDEEDGDGEFEEA